MADNDFAGSLLVGEGVRIQGRLELPQRILVNGEIDGDVIAREIHVGPTGRIKGTVTVQDADVRGEILDRVSCARSLTVRATGRIIGSVAYNTLEIEQGGVISGALQRTEAPAGDAGVEDVITDVVEIPHHVR